jgi:hypothetical protein
VNGYQILVAAIGYMHGYVGIGTVPLCKVLANSVISSSRDFYDRERLKSEPCISNHAAYVISTMAVLILHFVVMEFSIEFFVAHSGLERSHIGKIWLLLFFSGMAAVRLLPEIESAIRGKKLK